MSQNPYSNIGTSGTQYAGGPAVSGDFIDPAPTRTSVLAIIALVVSIVGCIACIVPGPGAIAATLGGLAIFFIARSAGRLTGMGIAVTAIVLGLFQSVAIIALLVGASQVNSQVGKEFFGPMGQTMAAIEKGDKTEARAAFSPAASAAITDQMIDDFAKQYQANAGHFQKMPESILETISMFIEVSKANKQSGNQNPPFGRNSNPNEPAFPMPAKFSQGSAIIIIAMDPAAMNRGQTPSGTKKLPKLLNIGVITLDGKEAWLLDPDVARKLLFPGPGGGSSSSGNSSSSTPTSTIEDAPKRTEPPKKATPESHP